MTQNPGYRVPEIYTLLFGRSLLLGVIDLILNRVSAKIPFQFPSTLGVFQPSTFRVPTTGFRQCHLKKVNFLCN